MVELRPVQKADSDRLFEWRNLPDVRQFMFNDDPIQRDDHDGWMQRSLVDPTRRDWIIEFQTEPVGLISLTDIDEHQQRCSWGFYVAAASLRGRGLGSNAWYQALQVAFDGLGMEKVCSEVLSTNQSVVVMHERFGFRREAYHRSHVYRAGGRIDVVGLALLRHEWHQCRPTLAGHLVTDGHMRPDRNEP
jgi:UDP-4-amino-4,6-dideoxy-N-acetyl-beta-L-altrosamine N-acetyltransferase